MKQASHSFFCTCMNPMTFVGIDFYTDVLKLKFSVSVENATKLLLEIIKHAISLFATCHMAVWFTLHYLET